MTRLDVDAHDVLKAFCDRHHVTQVQLLGAIIRRFPGDGRLPRWLAEAVEEARDMDSGNRRRD